MCATRHITEPQRQLLATLGSMIGCDHPLLLASGMIKGLTKHLVPDAVNVTHTPEALTKFINDISKASDNDIVAVCASNLSAEAIDVGSFELFLYKKSCCAQQEYKQLVAAVLDQLDAEDKSDT